MQQKAAPLPQVNHPFYIKRGTKTSGIKDDDDDDEGPRLKRIKRIKPRPVVALQTPTYTPSLAPVDMASSYTPS